MKRQRENRVSIRLKIAIALLLVGFSTLFGIGTITLYGFYHLVIEETQNHLVTTSALQKERIQAFIHHQLERADLVSGRTQLRLTLQRYSQQPQPGQIERMRKILRDAQQALPDLNKIDLYTTTGTPLLTTSPTMAQPPSAPHPFGEVHQSRILDVEWTTDNRLNIVLISPLILEGETLGVLLVHCEGDELRRITQNYSGMGRTGETVLAQKGADGSAQFIVPRRFEQPARYDRTIAADQRDIPIIRAINQELGFYDDIVDYRETPIYAVTDFIPETNWGLVNKIDQEEALAPFVNKVTQLGVVMVFLLLLILVVIDRLSGSISRPILQLTQQARSVQSDWRQQLTDTEEYDDETAHLVDAFDEVTHELIGIFESSPDGILIADAQGTLLRCNQALLNLFGYRREELLGHSVERLLPQSLRVDHRRLREGFTQAPVARPMGKSRPLVGLHKEGREIPIETSLAPVSSSSQQLIMANVRDISERLQMEQLRQKSILAEQANRAKDEFLASMSHELRTPLTTIIGHCELLQEEEQDPGRRQQLQSIATAGQSQLNLVNDILDIAKIESGKFTIEEIPYKLEDLLHRLEQTFSHQAREAGLQFNVELLQPQKFQHVGDCHRISQILNNLVSNAIKFTPGGQVTVTVWEESQELFFKVADSGIGMPPEVMDRLFHRFEQADGSISRRFGGSGLGLYISLNLAEMMGGTIDASSREREGSVFQLQLPLRRGAPLTTITATTRARATTDGVVAKEPNGNILVAEDTPALQLLIRTMLQRVGYHVELASNGVEAVEQVRSHAFDLVLMDMQMPEMDGIEATRLLREEGRTLPIIALTANVMPQHREAFSAAGCSEFLAKPINKELLLETLARYLNPKGGESARPPSP